MGNGGIHDGAFSGVLRSADMATENKCGSNHVRSTIGLVYDYMLSICEDIDTGNEFVISAHIHQIYEGNVTVINKIYYAL